MRKKKTLERVVQFTDRQMIQARATGKFKDHRAFVRWLFRGQHKMVVTNYDGLVFEYLNQGRDCVVKVTGLVGSHLGAL